jgi:flagellar basal body L-ring protein FlgH
MPMIAFEIQLNGQKLCLAGVGDSGVLSAIVTWAATAMATGTRNESLFLDIGGLINPRGERVSWTDQKPLATGDVIQVKIIEADSVDQHQVRDPRDEARFRQAREDQVRRMAKELGWKIEVPAKPAGEIQ